MVSVAQQGEQIRGLIKDRETGQVLENVTVTVEGSQVRTGPDGTFVLTGLSPGSYQIRISFVGYDAVNLDPVAVPNSAKPINLGTIYLDITDNTLDEVVITHDPPLVEFGADTVTFNASKSIMAEGSVASDLLKSVPMVDVDIDGKPTIAGKINTRIFINGKPSDYTGETLADLLNVLPSDAIEKVEVVTNPDVRYAADGDGIINIVLAKGYRIGLNGAVTLTAGTIDNYNGSAYIAFRDKGLSLNTSYGYRNITRLSEANTFRSNYRAGERTTPNSFIDQLSDGDNFQQGHNVRSSVDWDITPKQNLSVSANFNTATNTAGSVLDDYRLNADRDQQEYRAQQNGSNFNGINYELNAHYTAKFGKNNEILEAGLVAYSNAREQERHIFREIARANGNDPDPFGQFMGNMIDNRRVEMNVNYRRPITKMLTFSTGFNSSMSDNGNAQAVTGFDYSTGTDTVNSVLSNTFRYTEMIHALYTSFNFRTRTRWSFRAGLRAEHTQLTLKETAGPDASPDPYLNVFPNVSVSKVIKKRHSLNASYSMRLMRPREHMLNPLVNNSNPANVSFGNPYLQPSYIHQYQLSYGTSGQRWTFNPRLSYATSGDIIERFRVSADSVTYLNLASRNALTANFIGNYKHGRNLTFNWGAMVSRVDYHSPSSLVQRRTGWSSRFNMGASATLPHKIAAEARVTYVNNVLSQGRQRGSVTTDFGFRKSFLSNKFQVRLMATDPFFDQNTLELVDGMTASGATYLQESSRVLRTRNYRVSVSYRFTRAGQQPR